MDQYSPLIIPTTSGAVPLDHVGFDPLVVAYVIGQRIIDAERTVCSLRLSDIHVTVSAHCQRGTTSKNGIVTSGSGCGRSRPATRKNNEDELFVRPRILPAVKTSTGFGRPYNGYQVLKSAARRRRTAPSISDSTHDVTDENQLIIAEPSRLNELPPEVLNSGAIICPGCRDSTGQPVLIFTCRMTSDTPPAVWRRANVVHLARLALYCCCNSCCCGGSDPAASKMGTSNRTRRTQCNGDVPDHVTLIIDTRTAGLTELDTLAEVLRIIEASQPEVFKSVYVLVDKITEAVLSQASLFPPESSAKVELVDEEELGKFLVVNCLPTDLGGDLAFDVTRWIDYQQKLDSFVVDCYDVAARLMAATDEITRTESLPSSVYESKVTIDRHDSQVQTILEQPHVRRLLESGDDVLDQLSKMIDNLGSGIVFRDCLDATTELYQQVCNGCRRLMDASNQRSSTLQKCLQLRQFEDRASTIINWLCTEGEDGLKRQVTLADNLRAIEAQWIDLDKFSSVAQGHVDASADVLDEAAMMTQLGVCDEVTGVREVCRELKGRTTTFITRLTTARSTVDSALKCYLALDQIYEWALDTMKLIDNIRRQRSLSQTDIERSLADLDNCSSRRPPLPDFNFALRSSSHSIAAVTTVTVESSPSCQQSPPLCTSSSPNGGLSRLAERCRLAATRSVETGNHLEMCRTALRDALRRLVDADSSVTSISPVTADCFSARQFQTPTVDEAPSFCRRRRQTTPCLVGTPGVNSSSHSSLSSSASFLLPVADVGMLAANLCSVSSAPAFDVSDYMIEGVSRHDSTVFVEFSNDDDECVGEQRTVTSHGGTVVADVRVNRGARSPETVSRSRRSSVTNLEISGSRADFSNVATSRKDKTPFEGRQQFDRGVSNRRNSSAFPSQVVIGEPLDVETINRSASSALLGSLSASILAIASTPSSMSFSSTPLRASCSSTAVNSSRTPPMSSLSTIGGGTDRASKRLRQRWKILRKAFSTIVDGNDSSQGRLFDDAQLERQRQLLIEYQQQLNGGGMQDISVESLPGLYTDDTLTCIVNETADEISSAGDTMRSKYGWMATPAESNGTTQLVYANRHALPSRSSSLVDLHSVENEARRNRVLLYVMQELVQTERDYVRALGYVINNYIPEILSESVPQQLRGKKSVIFENLEKIYDFHSQTFLTKIEKCASCPYRLGGCFLQHESELYMYALYNKNKPKSDELMMECGSKYFKAKQIELNDRMDLSSYLLKPVQRMGKYALLLAQITDECPTTHPDHVDLKAALEMIRFQLRHGNDLLAMDCIRSCDVNLQEQGMLLRQAEFIVLNGRKKCLRHVFLFEELVLFSKTRHSPTGNDVYVYKHSMKTSDIGLTESIGESGDAFELWFRKRTPGSTFKLRACSVNVCAEWVRDISRLLWKQTMRNRERRLAEMACLGVGNKPSLDLKPSDDNINDRFVQVPVMHRGVRMRTSMPSSSLMSRDHHLRNGSKRPHSLVSVSSSSSSGSGLSASGLLNGLLRHGYSMSLTMTPVSSSSNAASTSVDGVTALGGSVGLFGTQPGLGTLSTMHESPLELITESSPSQVLEEVSDDFDKSSLLREIDDQLNAIANDNKSTTSSNSSDGSDGSAPYDTAASDTENGETAAKGLTGTSIDGDLVNNEGLSAFETAEDDGGISDEDAEEYRLFASDLTIPDLYDQLSITKPCLADINML